MEIITKFLEDHSIVISKVSLSLNIVISLVLSYVALTANFADKSLYKNSSVDNIDIKEVKVVDVSLQPIVFEVVGMVEKPGVYYSSRSLIVLEAIEQAGGLSEDADLDFIHQNIALSKPVIQYQKIYIPSKSSAVINTSINTSSNGQDNIININSSTKSEIESLPGIGETIANRIILARPFSKKEDIKTVEGITENLYNKIVSLIVI